MASRYFRTFKFVCSDVVHFGRGELSHLPLPEGGRFVGRHTTHTQGFEHSAFTFGCESAATTEHCHVNPTQVLPGTLIGLLQKGLQYIQLEVEACSPQEVD